MGLFNSKTRSVVGLDIEPGFVAAAEFSQNGKPVLVRAATTSLGPGLFHEGEVVDVDALADRLRAFFRDNDLPKKVRLGVASQKMAVRVMELPAIDDEQELDAAIRFQAQEELPMPVEQAVLDHRLLERIDDEKGGRMRILVVAARRDSVEHLLAAARRAGLTSRAGRSLGLRHDPRSVRVARSERGGSARRGLRDARGAPRAGRIARVRARLRASPCGAPGGARLRSHRRDADAGVEVDVDEHDGFGGEFGDVTIADEQIDESRAGPSTSSRRPATTRTSRGRTEVLTRRRTSSLRPSPRSTRRAKSTN